MRPPTCGVTVTDSNAVLCPISSRYFGTSCAVAFTTVTSGGGMAGGAACALLRLQAVLVTSISPNASSAAVAPEKITLGLLMILILIWKGSWSRRRSQLQSCALPNFQAVLSSRAAAGRDAELPLQVARFGNALQRANSSRDHFHASAAQQKRTVLVGIAL